MPAPAETVSLGLPVAIDRIDRELKKLWSEGEGALTRASLMNLAVYSEEPDSLNRNTQLLARITENHACRAIVIGANSQAKNDRMEAWISAHCHISRAGTKRVCSEQISFLLEGATVKFLPSIVFSQLDSDLPLYLWWQSEFAEPMDAQLWSWIDRLIYDSQSWHDFNAQIRLVETAQREAKQRIVLCDLNWTRLVRFRLAFAQFFDHPGSHHQLREKGDAPIASFTAQSGEIEFQVILASGGDLLEVCRGKLGEAPARQVLPSAENDPVKLMSEELMRGGPHHVYLRAVEKVRALL